jgi:uncharacterized protein
MHAAVPLLFFVATARLAVTAGHARIPCESGRSFVRGFAHARATGKHYVTVDVIKSDHRGELVQKYVLFYESADDVMSKAPPVYPRHLARLKEFRDRGDLLLVGTFGDPQAEGSMAVFGSRDAAEEFVRDDPFVNEGVVKTWTLREWDEVASEI